jgi:hypothetical protein
MGPRGVGMSQCLLRALQKTYTFIILKATPKFNTHVPNSTSINGLRILMKLGDIKILQTNNSSLCHKSKSMFN